MIYHDQAYLLIFTLSLEYAHLASKGKERVILVANCSC